VSAALAAAAVAEVVASGAEVVALGVGVVVLGAGVAGMMSFGLQMFHRPLSMMIQI